MALAILAVPAAAQSPVIHRISPGALRGGAETLVTVSGENLAGTTGLWTSFPATVVPLSNSVPLGAELRHVSFGIRVPNDGLVGIGAVRLVTANGLSDLYPLMIDDLPDAVATGTNKTLQTAQALTMPIAVDGACDERKSHYYQIEARKGERISLDVVAARMGSSLDPLVRLLDADARELAYCDDAADSGRDPHLDYRFVLSGRIFLELRDARYEGGPAYRYRLRLSRSRLARVIFLPRVDRPAGLEASARRAEFTEIEPNDTPACATKISVPSTLKGEFAASNDEDFFEFAVRKGERWVFLGKTRSLGSPCDLYLELRRSDGSTSTQGNIVGAGEGAITNTFSDAGKYQLLVEELNHRGGPGLSYQVQISRYRPGFELDLESDRLEAAASASCRLKVSAVRQDYDGPIKLGLDPPIQGLTLTNNVIAPRTNTAVVTVMVSGDLKPGHLVHFTVVGKARINGADVQIRAHTIPALRKVFPLLLDPPAAWDGLITLGVGAGAGTPARNSPAKPRHP